MDGSQSKKRKREPQKVSSVFTRAPCENKLESLLKSVHCTPFGELKSKIAPPHANPTRRRGEGSDREKLQHLVDTLLPQIQAQVTKSLEHFQKIYKNLIEKPLRIISPDDDDSDVLLGITLPDPSTQAHQDLPLPPAKRAKKGGAASSSSTNATTTELVNSSLDESFSLLDTSFQDENLPQPPPPPRPNLLSPNSEPSKNKYKQTILFMRPRHTRTLPRNSEASLTDSIHKPFFSKFRISKKYQSPLSSSNGSTGNILAPKSASRGGGRLLDPSSSKFRSQPPSILPLNFSDLTTLSNHESNVDISPSSSSSSTILAPKVASPPPSSKATASLLSPIRPANFPAKSAPSSSVKKTSATAPKSKPPKTPAKKRPASGGPTVAGKDALAAAGTKDPGAEADVDVASMLIGLAAKSKSTAALLSPSKQTTLLQFLPAVAAAATPLPTPPSAAVAPPK